MVILTKIVVFVLVLSILIVFKETMIFGMAWMENTKMDISNMKFPILHYREGIHATIRHIGICRHISDLAHRLIVGMVM